MKYNVKNNNPAVIFKIITGLFSLMKSYLTAFFSFENIIPKAMITAKMMR